MCIKYWTLNDDRRSVTEVDLMTWANYYERPTESRIVEETTLPSGRIVRTIFFGMTDQLGMAPMAGTGIYGPDWTLEKVFEEYDTIEAALAGHQKAAAARS